MGCTKIYESVSVCIHSEIFNQSGAEAYKLFYLTCNDIMHWPSSGCVACHVYTILFWNNICIYDKSSLLHVMGGS